MTATILGALAGNATGAAILLVIRYRILAWLRDRIRAAGRPVDESYDWDTDPDGRVW